MTGIESTSKAVLAKCTLVLLNESEFRSLMKSSMNMVEFCRMRGHTVNVFFTIIIHLNQSFGGDNLFAAETGHNFDVKLVRLTGT